MTWTSELRPGETIVSVTDPTPTTPGGYSTGYEMRDYRRHPVGYSSAGAAYLAKRPRIPRSEWDDRIAEKEREKSRISDILDAAKVPSTNQNGTNYCWFFGVVGACQARRAVAGQPLVLLSPAYGACQIKSFRNQGGWGQDAVDWMVEHGVCSTDLWPQAAINRRYLTDEARAQAAKFKLLEYDDIEQNDFDTLMSALISDDPAPCPLGLDWWGHLIFACDGVKIGPGKYGVRIRNSWGADYGSNGYAVLEERRARGDCSAIRVMSGTDYA